MKTVCKQKLICLHRKIVSLLRMRVAPYIAHIAHAVNAYAYAYVCGYVCGYVYYIECIVHSMVRTTYVPEIATTREFTISGES